MAVVYLARHDVLRRKVAVKLLRQKVQAFEPFVERFRREARAAGRMVGQPLMFRAAVVRICSNSQGFAPANWG